MTPAEIARATAARRARYEQLRQITPVQARNLSDLARSNPSLSAGALYGAGVGGVRPGTPAAKALGQADQEVKSSGNIFQRAISGAYKGIKFVGGAVLPDEVGQAARGAGGVVKGVTRGADIGLSSVGQFAQGIGRAAYADGFQFSDIKAGIDQTDLQAAQNEIKANGGYLGLLTGETDVDYGSGFFAGGNVTDRSMQAKREASGGRTIGGKMYTAGRYLANEIGLEPGNLAYNALSGLIDASVVLGTDPTSYAGAPTKALQARRAFAGDASKRFDAEGVARGIDERLAATKAERFGASVDPEQLKVDVGALPGIRNTVSSDRVLEWLTTERQGQDLVKVLADETDFGKLYDATKGKVDPQILLKITERQMTGDEVIEILGPTLGRTARTDEKFAVDAVAKVDAGLATGPGGLGTLATAKFKQKARDVRMFGAVPERVLPKNDINSTLKVASDFMRNAKIGAADEVVVDGRKISRSEILRRFTQADGGEGMFEVAKDMMTLGAHKAMTEYGIDSTRARALFQMYENAVSDGRKYWQQQIVENGEKKWVQRAFNTTEADVMDDGELRALPHLASQFLDNNIPLPDPREIRGELSKFARLLGNRKGADAGKGQQAWNKAIEIPESALTFISDQVFKPLVLLRPAFIVRNQIDEQFRPAAAGLDSLFSHPVSYLQWMLTDQKGVGKLLASRGVKTRGETDALGQGFDEMAAATRAARETYKDAIRTGDADLIAETKAAYETTRKQVQTLTPFTEGANEYARAVTGGMGNWRNRSYAQVKDTVLYQRSEAHFSRAMGEGLHLIYNDPLAKKIAAGADLEQLKADWWRGPLQRFRTDLAKQGERMSYLNDEIGAAKYVEDTAEMVRSIVGDSPDLRAAAASGRIGGVPLTNGDTLEISQRALAKLDALKALPGFQGPPAVIGARRIGQQGDEVGMYTAVVDKLFYGLNDVPVRKLSKSPVFRQRYYKRMENLIGFADDEAAAAIIKGAQDANLKPADVKRLQSKVRPGGDLTLLEADVVAKADALEYTRELFYDLHGRSQFFDALRLVFPFGEVFLDSARKYTALSAQNPVLPYRLMQVVEGARDGDLNGDGDGFFYTDEQTGEEMFSFPGSTTMLNLLGQEGAGKMRAPVQNLNILGTTVIPGFGPAVQIAASVILPDEPDFNAVQSFISPYGERTLEGGALESFLPSWFGKFATGLNNENLTTPKQQRAFVQTTKDWMGYLASTGEYDLTDPADAQRLTDDAKGKARATFFIRGMAQAFAPSPPSPEFVAYDKDGRLLTQFKLAEEYRRIQDEQRDLGTPEATNRIFIETFGEQAVLAVVPNTKAAQDKSPLPPNKEALEFYQRNKDAAARFPTVFGLFAPDEDGAEFDWVTYNRSISSGERVAISPEEAIRRANSNVARMILQNAKDIVGENPDRAQKAALTDLKRQLSEDFPGYSTAFSNDTPALLEDLKRAAADPQLAKTPAGQGLSVWLKAREAAESAAQAQYGVSWKTAQASRPIRDTMRVLAEELSNDFPGFNNIYERALEREMTRD